jgi:hypothetical protein
MNQIASSRAEKTCGRIVAEAIGRELSAFYGREVATEQGPNIFADLLHRLSLKESSPKPT